MKQRFAGRTKHFAVCLRLRPCARALAAYRIQLQEDRMIPGEAYVMADLKGPGVVSHIWLTAADNEFAWPRLVRLRVYYDGKKTPSIDVPLGDFFGVGHGYDRNLDSVVIRNSSFGRARN